MVHPPVQAPEYVAGTDLLLFLGACLALLASLEKEGRTPEASAWDWKRRRLHDAVVCEFRPRFTCASSPSSNMDQSKGVVPPS